MSACRRPCNAGSESGRVWLGRGSTATGRCARLSCRRTVQLTHPGSPLRHNIAIKNGHRNESVQKAVRTVVTLHHYIITSLHHYIIDQEICAARANHFSPERAGRERHTSLNTSFAMEISNFIMIVRGSFCYDPNDPTTYQIARSYSSTHRFTDSLTRPLINS
jgi:hypothetical protein